jgi:hypothetical protein
MCFAEQVGNERVGLAPYNEYLASSGKDLLYSWRSTIDQSTY